MESAGTDVIRKSSHLMLCSRFILGGSELELPNHAPGDCGCISAGRFFSALCRKDRYQHVRQMLDAEIGALSKNGEIGNGRSFDNVKATMGGNDPVYALRRLKRDRPDLAQRVIVGELSAHAAAIEAGITGKPWKVLSALIEPYDKPMAMEIESFCNPGSGARTDLSEPVNNINRSEPAKGTSRSYTLNRLRRESPELFNAVVGVRCRHGGIYRRRGNIG